MRASFRSDRADGVGFGRWLVVVSDVSTRHGNNGFWVLILSRWRHLPSTALIFVLPAAIFQCLIAIKKALRPRGALVPIAMVTLVAVLPWFLLSWAVQTTSGAYVGPTSWVYWAILPLTTVLQCARTISFAVANAVCFEERTGWHPGAEKIEP